MATTEEKTELVETLKGPRFYRIRLYGYGGEAAYINLTKEAYDFWHNHTEEHYDSDFVQYLVNDDPEDCDYQELEVVPKEADFLTSYGEDDYKSAWYEAPTEFCHQNGVEYSNASIEVEEVDSDDYSANYIRDVELGNNSLNDLVDAIQEEDSEKFDEMVSWGDGYEFAEQGKYVCQMYSAEKGTFFEAIIETISDFDFKKLKILNNEYPNGEDIVDGLEYDGVELDNQGGDTNGKGYSAHVWST
jgi:DNA polymerase I-like protein with 3'-5' exonuclease and polymerase domains